MSSFGEFFKNLKSLWPFLLSGGSGRGSYPVTDRQRIIYKGRVFGNGEVINLEIKKVV